MDENTVQAPEQTPEPVPQPPQQPAKAQPKEDPELREFKREMDGHAASYIKGRIETKQEEARDRQFRESVDAEGNWKTLGHSMQYFGELPQAEGPDDPNPYSYHPNQKEKYESDRARAQFRRDMAAAQKMAEQPEPDPLPPDYKKGVIKDILKSEVGTLRPSKKDEQPSLREQIIAQKEAETRLRDISLYGNQRADQDPGWNLPEVQDEAAQHIAHFNHFNKENAVILPIQETPWGDVAEIRPSNMRFITLEPRVYEDFRRALKERVARGARDPVSVLRESWNVLRKMGYLPDNFNPTYRRGEEPQPEPPWKNQREFVAWRKKNGTKF